MTVQLLHQLGGEIDFYKENVDFFNDVLVNDDLGLLLRSVMCLYQVHSSSRNAWTILKSWQPAIKTRSTL